ncbi:MAG: phage tail sheath subtilisin-like domain-containing protein [Treponema sp.]|jgi:phage tail sheath gpL-like|nr:phage tail sheath subtilisin-like domain-containing protein [Treponema sp.]
MIPIRQIQANLLVPGQYQEVDNSLAGTQEDIKKVLLIGYKTSAGSATEGVPVQVGTDAQAVALCGAGSDAASMAAAFLAINSVEELWIVPISEPAAGTKWSIPYTVSGTATEAGTLDIQINGRTISLAIASEDSAASIAAALVAGINSETTLSVEAAATDAVVTISALVKGILGNHNRISITARVAGVSISRGTESSGTGTVDLSSVLASLGEVRYHYLAVAFDDTANSNKLAAELESRYGAMRQIGGRAFVALSGSLGSVSTSGSLLSQAQGINSPHILLIPRENNPGLPCVWAAAWCAAACRILADDPAANTYDTQVNGIIADREFAINERQRLLEAGIATYRRDTAGTVLIERLVTSYTENSDGARDTSYLDVQVVETVDAVRTYINREARKRFKTWKLSSTGENFGSSAKVMSTGVFRSFLAELYSEVFIKEKQWCQDFEHYLKSIRVEVKAGSKTRLEYSHEPILIGQFYIGAGLLQFK